MTVQEYIESSLKNLLEPSGISKPSDQELVEAIYRIVMSKKFRKYSASPELTDQIRGAIKINVEKNLPINFTFPHGAYKLWSLEEAPFPDWAELFAAMYYTKWLKPICEIYTPGVWFDYFVDDIILPKMDNISLADVESYITEYTKIIDFLRSYQPKNFKMTITKFEDQVSSVEDFYESLDERTNALTKTNPTFSEEDLQAVELNANPTPEQKKDPKWREKIRTIHDAYIGLKRDIGYYYKEDKIPVFSQPLPSGKFIIVGTTKTSIAKFWVGIGALKKMGDSFIEYILSPKQIEKTKFSKEKIAIEGLEGRNFEKIRIITDS
ncbi:MAG: hypothetical protein WD231_01515 [Candidatus Woykebacteria bacterium]